MPDPLTPVPALAPALASTGTTTFLAVIGLLIVAVAMVGVAVWLIRTTRAEPSALGPLEVMGDRSWRKADADTRASSLAAARPPGAVPPAPMLEYEPAALEPEPGSDTPPETERPSAGEVPADSEPPAVGQPGSHDVAAPEIAPAAAEPERPVAAEAPSPEAAASGVTATTEATSEQPSPAVEPDGDAEDPGYDRSDG